MKTTVGSARATKTKPSAEGELSIPRTAKASATPSSPSPKSEVARAR
jgi:hypothetical protein